MTKYPPSRTSGLRQMKALVEGEGSETFRVRAQRPLLKWFKAMSAEERGAVLMRLMIEVDQSPFASVTPATASVEVRKGKRVVPFSDSPTQPSHRTEQVRTASLSRLAVLRVVSSKIPSSLRNHLRWPPQRYEELEATLSRESVLKLVTIKGKTAWRTSTGESIRKDTVARLFQAGLLVND